MASPWGPSIGHNELNSISFIIVFFSLQENIPLISVMCNKGMRPRHWSQMGEITGFDITPDSGTTLRKMLKLNLGGHMEQFESISGAATKVSSQTRTVNHRK